MLDGVIVALGMIQMDDGTCLYLGRWLKFLVPEAIAPPMFLPRVRGRRSGNLNTDVEKGQNKGDRRCVNVSVEEKLLCDEGSAKAKGLQVQKIFCRSEYADAGA